MAQAISNKVLVQGSKYCWMICDYTMSGSTMSYSLSFYFEGGCAQLDNAWIKVGSTTVWSNTGRVHNYEGNPAQSGHTVSIHSGTTTISGSQTVTFGITKYSGVAMSGSFTVSGASSPSSLTITGVSSTYNSITGTIKVGDWGGGTQTYHELLVLNTAYTQGGLPQRYESSTSNPATLTVTNNSTAGSAGAVTITGASTYYIGQYANNGSVEARQDGGTVSTPPAPLQTLSYTQTQGASNVTVGLTITGGTSSDNSSNTVTTYYRYSANGGTSYSAWTSAGTGTAWTSKTASFTCPYGASVVVQAKQTYDSKDSVVKQVSFTATTGTGPSGGTLTVTSSMWNSVSLSASGVSYGYPNSISGRSITIGIRASTSATSNNRTKTTTNVTSATATLNNSSATTTTALTLKGMLPVYPILIADNTVKTANVVLDNTPYYLPPAPGTGSYTDDGNGDYTISYTGVAANNVTNYVASDLARTVRYKIDNGAWVYVDNAAVKTLTTVTSQQISIPYQSTATVEAWLTYKGKNSTVTSFTVSNMTNPVHLYGSVSGQTKEVQHLYGSVNGQTKKITKLYGSVGGVSKLIFQDT